MKLKVITPPTSTPVTLNEAKSYYRVIGTEEEGDIIRSIEAATEKAEQITNRQLATATYAGYLDSFVSSVKLPRPPFQSISKIEYIDADGMTQTFTDYTVDDVVEPAVLYFGSIPTDVKRDGVNNIIITFTCGYADTKTPSAIKSWILIYGLTMFESRQNMVDGVKVDATPNDYYKHLLDSFRIVPV